MEHPLDDNPLREFQNCRSRLYNALDGYHIEPVEVDTLCQQYVAFLLECPRLPVAELEECLSVLEMRMPEALTIKFTETITRLSAFVEEIASDEEEGDNFSPHGPDSMEDVTSISSPTIAVASGGAGIVSATVLTSQLSGGGASLSCATTARPRLQVIEERSAQRGAECSIRSFDTYLRDAIQDLHFAFSRGGGDFADASYLDDPIFRENLVIVETLLMKYFQGSIQAAVNEIRSMILYYLEVEEMFHNSDCDSAGLVLHSKRPEFEPEQLLEFARSHQALKIKNRLMLNLLNALKNCPELFDQADQFEAPLRRLAAFSKIDYSALSHESRQLLLTRRDKTFLQNTHALIETLWDILESYSVHSAPSGPTSPVTFGGRLWSTYFPSPTASQPHQAGSGCLITQSAGNYSYASATSIQPVLGPSTTSAGLAFPPFVSGVNISCCALDLARFPTDSLVAILGHHNPKLKKLAIHILVMRTFGIRQGKVHDFRVRAQHETWDVPAASHHTEKTPVAWNGFVLDPETYGMQSDSRSQRGATPANIKFATRPHRTFSPSPRHMQIRPSSTLVRARSPDSSSRHKDIILDGGLHIPNLVAEADIVKSPVRSNLMADGTQQGLQEINALVAIWTHEAIFSYDYLTSQCDPLRTEALLKPEGSSPGFAQSGLNAPPTEGSLTSRIDQTGQNGNTSLASRYVAAGSRLHHMLNAFAGTSDDPQGPTGKSQQTTAFLIESLDGFETNFASCLREIKDLQAFLPPAPSAVDGKILLCVILDLHPSKENQPHRTFSGLLTADERSTTTFFSNEPNHGTFAHVVNQNAQLLTDLHFNLVWLAFLGVDTLGQSSPEPDTTRGASRRVRSTIRGFDFLPLEVPGLKCFYFRNVRALPFNASHCDDAVVPLIPAIPASPKKADEPTYVEESLLRHCEIPLFQYLELRRLRNFIVSKHPTTSPNVHLFEAVPKSRVKTETPAARFFVRIVTNLTEPPTSEIGLFEQERCFVNGLNALELSLREAMFGATRPIANHHILMTVVYIPQEAARRPHAAGTAGATTRASPALVNSNPQADIGGAPAACDSLKLTPSAADQIARDLYERYNKRIQKLGASVIEIRFKTRGWQILGHSQSSPSLTEGVYPYRIVLDNPTGQTLRSRRYVEIQNPSTGERVFAALDSRDSLSTLILKSTTSNAGATAFDRTTSVTLPLPSPLSSTGVKKVSLLNQTAAGFDLAEAALSYIRESREHNDYDGKPVDTPHPWAGPLESKRAQAAALQTLYIYDFIDLLEDAVKNMWRKCPKYLFGAGDESRDPSDIRSARLTDPNELSDALPLLPTATTLVPDRVVEAVELALNKNGDFVELIRGPGQNECGMVAWRVLLRTPEFPKGRRIVLIGNDVTYFMGTFGVQEDLLFQRASELARLHGIPRVYIAVNSGARMGLATEVQSAFKVEWIDPEQPNRGFKYLYLTDADYSRLQASDSVVAEPVTHPTEGRVHKILHIIGSQIGLGVENLCGSGAIAGETSRAYRSSMTLTYVTGRTVGIGAYLTRLGHRVIQKSTGAPILLTGYQALNRLIGRQVYTSNEEIGGIDVMQCNGVSHLVVQSDLEGCERILEWLSFVPEHKEGPLPVMIDPSDPISRKVEYRPSSATEDPRHMLTGCVDSNGRWLGGILDRGSFKEVMAEWARSVIVGRGRLGGIPVGVISVETRVTEMLLPADPAMPLTSEVKLNRAGLVWFPESAYKTAQAISDFNREEIPLIIFANWRGFSGGQRDMFYEVLKFGSMIVDALVDFQQPCFVYIPPKAELRGGAWVVVDPRINSDYMEMFADPDSRGGVLEPNGTVEIKFREKALRDAATRSDPELRRLTREDVKLANEGVPLDDPRRLAGKERKEARLNHLMPVIKQVAVHFADLHDTPVRMKRKHAIHDVIGWDKSRQFFYWRLRRQLILFNLRNEAIKHHPKLTLSQAQKCIYRWASESGHSVENSQQFVQWACHSIQDLSRRLHGLRTQYLKETVADFCRESVNAVAEGIRMVDPNSQERLLHLLAAFEKEAKAEQTSAVSANGHESNAHSNKTSSECQQAALERITMSARLMDCMHGRT